jgi:hypothetical protein
VRRTVQFTAAGIWLASALSLAIAGDHRADAKNSLASPAPAKAASCGNYGTSVEFVSSPSEAARLAKQQQKLVFVLHVSGHFEDPTFT